jgi:hypothetical protein
MGGKVAGGLKLIIYLYLALRSRMMELYIHSPTIFHSAVLSFGTVLLVPDIFKTAQYQFHEFPNTQ